MPLKPFANREAAFALTGCLFSQPESDFAALVRFTGSSELMVLSVSILSMRLDKVV